MLGGNSLNDGGALNILLLLIALVALNWVLLPICRLAFEGVFAAEANAGDGDGDADGFCSSDPLLLGGKSPKDAGALNKILALPTGVVVVVVAVVAVALVTGKVALLLVEEAKRSAGVFEPKPRRADTAEVSAADVIAAALAPNDSRGCPPPPPPKKLVLIVDVGLVEGMVVSTAKRPDAGLETGSGRFLNGLLAVGVAKGWEPSDDRKGFDLELTSSFGRALNNILLADVVLMEVDAIDPNISGLAAGAEEAAKDAAARVKDAAGVAVVVVDEGNAEPEAALVLVAPKSLMLLPSGCAVEADVDDTDVEREVKVLLVGGVGLLVGGTSSSSSDKNELFDWLLLT